VFEVLAAAPESLAGAVVEFEASAALSELLAGAVEEVVLGAPPQADRRMVTNTTKRQKRRCIIPPRCSP